jgi:hypothetical protein
MFDAFMDSSDDDSGAYEPMAKRQAPLSCVVAVAANRTETASAQFGGSLTSRMDASVPVQDSLPFEKHEVDTAIRVVKLLGENLHLFRRLASLKPLRAALHPLITEQVRHGGYDTHAADGGGAASGGGGKKRGRKQTSKVSRASFSVTAALHCHLVIRNE